MVQTERISLIHQGKKSGDGAVVYWMSRDARVADNWALLHAQELAYTHKRPLVVVYNLVPSFLGGGQRQFSFKVAGLKEVEEDLRGKNIPFYLFVGDDLTEMGTFLAHISPHSLVTDFFPLKIVRTWYKELLKHISCDLIEVDAHNVVPCRFVSQKQEFAARTIRPKITKLLPQFLIDFPVVAKQRYPWKHAVPRIAWSELLEKYGVADPKSLHWIGGPTQAHKQLRTFIEKRLPHYESLRNDPSLSMQSDLSPYLHYGHISAARVALTIKKLHRSINRDAFLEELVIRRELADNFCHYNPHYDSAKGFPLWAQKTLGDHLKDTREYQYTLAEFEHAQTHDELWNAAQLEMVVYGKMHGYMRMYWAKKILEWTKNPETAMRIAITLNDKYEMDGRDPNGYTGIAWSLGGVHDRPWFPRKIFGTIRYMSETSLRKKFDAKTYIARITKSAQQLSLL